MREAKARRLPRADALARLAQVEGVYVPSLYEPAYDGADFAGLTPKGDAQRRVRKRVVGEWEFAHVGACQAILIAPAEPAQVLPARA